MAKKKKALKRRVRGAPEKLDMMGPLHRYSPTLVPRELVRYFKIAVKRMMGTMTMSDYLRVRVMDDAQVKLKGERKRYWDCVLGGGIEWENISWIKDPENLMSDLTLVHYPKKHWVVFEHNCAVRGECTKHAICRYMIELVTEFIRWRKLSKKRRKK